MSFSITGQSIRLSEKWLSFANVFFTTVYLHTNVKPSLWNLTVFISTEQNRSYVIRQNNINQKTLCLYYFLIKRKKLFGQPNIISMVSRENSTTYAIRQQIPNALSWVTTEVVSGLSARFHGHMTSATKVFSHSRE